MNKLLILIPVIAGVLWGSVGVFVRVLTNAGFDNVSVLSVRMMFAAVILAVGIAIYDRKLFRIKLKDSWIFVAAGILGMMGLNFCYNVAINELTLSFAAVLLSLAPIFVMFFARILFHEKITMRKLVCTFFAVLGCFLVSGLLESSGMSWSVIGIIIGLMAAVFYALYSVFSKVAMERDYHVFTITFYSILIASVVLLPFTDWQCLGDFVSKAPLGNMIFLIVHSLCTSVLPYVLFTLSLNYVEAGKASILTAGGEPSAAMLFGLIFFAEMPTILSFAGLVITIAALSFLCAADNNDQ